MGELLGGRTLASSPPPYAGPLAPHIHLLVVQPTPFCNIQCDYCYLPDRESRARLTPAVFRQTLLRVFASPLVPDQLSIVWHAGEPLAFPVDDYAALFAEIDAAGIPRERIRHSIQTNALTVTDRWCDFIEEHSIRIGVSIDGPAFIHDRHRKDRQGKGTHARALKGVDVLRRRGIDFHVIAVITADALDHADAIFDFFLELGVQRLGFNVEELEGEHRSSSLMSAAYEARVEAFWRRLYERQAAAKGAIRIREFDRAYQSIVAAPADLTADAAMRTNSQVAPFAIVSVDWQGNVTSFSPELLGMKDAVFGDFILGNVMRAELSDLRDSAAFQRMATEIYAGVKKCASDCQYFAYCGGGAPSNKYSENGSFDSTETMYCRTSIQMPLAIVLADLERRLGL